MKIPTRIQSALKQAKVPEVLPEGRAFLIIGPHVWGRGKVFGEAFRNARTNGAGVEKSFILFNVPSKAWVDEMGRICWKWEEKEDAPQGEIEILRYGLKK